MQKIFCEPCRAHQLHEFYGDYHFPPGEHRRNRFSLFLLKTAHEIEQALAQGALIDQENDRGETRLMVACQLGEIEIVKVLLRHGAHVHHQDHDGWTAVHNAASTGNRALLLLLQGDATIQNKYGMTPLMIAASRGHCGAVQVLVPQCDPRATNAHGLTAYDLAAEAEQGEVCDMLKNYASDQTVMEGIWENERCHARSFTFSSRYLTKQDNLMGHLCTADLLPCASLDSVVLPEGWHWLTDFVIDRTLPCDQNGWLYARDFHHSDWTSKPVGTNFFQGWVRRRRWIRVRRKKSCQLVEPILVPRRSDSIDERVQSLLDKTLFEDPDTNLGLLPMETLKNDIAAVERALQMLLVHVKKHPGKVEQCEALLDYLESLKIELKQRAVPVGSPEAMLTLDEAFQQSLHS